MPLIATVLCLAFVAYLYRIDPRQEGETTSALWIPFVWMFIAGSRFLSSWLSFSSSESLNRDDGSPIDALLFLALIAAGAVVLVRRNVPWGRFFAGNKLLVAYFAYCLLSVVWADEPSISFKRWLKDLGNPIMVLVVLTEPAPLPALATLLRRLAYLLIPLSVLFVRWFPELGRVFGVDGTQTYTGLGQQKNALGQMCLWIGIVLAWQVLQDRERFAAWTRAQRLNMLVLAVLTGYLLYVSNSQTSLSCLLVAAAVLLVARLGIVRRRPPALNDIVLATSLLVLALESTIGIRDQVLDLLGRDPSLTSRTDLWAVLFEHSTAPVLGAGFMSFWTGERMAAIWAVVGEGVVQAHSGYIEQYLNLGYVGVGLTVLMLVGAFFRLRGDMKRDPAFAVLRLCFLCAAVLYNYTEASFYGVSNMWIVLLLALISPGSLRRHVRPPQPETQAPSRSSSATYLSPWPDHTRLGRSDTTRSAYALTSAGSAAMRSSSAVSESGSDGS